MNDRRTRILLVEDDPGDVALIRRALAGEPERVPGVRLEHVFTLTQGLDRLAKGDVDVLLLDLYLADSSGIDTLSRTRERDAAVPIVVFTTAGDESTAVRAIRSGAQDYLVKAELTGPLLRRVIRHAIERQQISLENRQLRGRLARAEKYESLALLAGGIAHDFGNLLTVIHGNAEVAKGEVPAESRARAALRAIAACATVASRLTSQLQSYSGGARLETSTIDVSDQIREMAPMLRGMLPGNVELRLSLEPELPAIDADAGQIQQIVMNLSLNAAESIGEESGTVEIVTGWVDLDVGQISKLATGERTEPGRFVRLEVRDSGCGIDKETVARIFDPFFTTKSTGRGLGLSSVLGIVRAHQGILDVEGAREPGSIFTIYLPTCESRPGAPRRELRELRGAGCILIVDDDEAVRELVEWDLESRGYSILVAGSGGDAVEIARARGEEIDLVLLDLTMPGMDGHQTFAELRRLRPDLDVIFWSGFDATRRPGPLPYPGVAFIQKPFELPELAAKVEEVLAQSRRRPVAG